MRKVVILFCLGIGVSVSSLAHNNEHCHDSLLSQTTLPTSVHDPYVLWNSEAASKTENVFVLVHGLAESPHGMREIADLYGRHGNVYALSLHGHGVSEQDLLQASHVEWAKEVERGVQFAKQHLGDNVVLVGYSVGAGLSLAYQARAFQDPNLVQVQGVSLHSPVFRKGSTFAAATENAELSMKEWLERTPGSYAIDFPGFYLGETSEHTFAAPIPLFRQLDEFADASSAFLEVSAHNPTIQAFIRSNTRLGLFFSLRDPKIDSERTLEYIRLISNEGANLVSYVTKDKLRHEDTIRSSSRSGTVHLEVVEGPVSESLAIPRAETIKRYVDSFVSGL